MKSSPKDSHALVALGTLFLAAFMALNGGAAQADPHIPGQSLNVAYIDSLSVINGGSFPSTTTGPTGSFNDFNFFSLPVAAVSSANLGPGGVCGAVGCDTVLLNVASSGMSCNINSLSPAAKADLVQFVDDGGKLIIYDSECQPGVGVDYSWLPYPFSTSNPGPLGQPGTLLIAEENYLSSGDPANAHGHYIDAAAVGSGTDAVGDTNVLVSFDPHWIEDMTATNYLQATGPGHVYAVYDGDGDTNEGIFIYNGLDVDYLGTATTPDSGYPSGNLAKIWLQELQLPFNPCKRTNPPACPGVNPVVDILLTPTIAFNPLGQVHTVTAKVEDDAGAPQVGVDVDFVATGPNADAGTDTTDANGEATFTLTGDGGVGVDEIVGSFFDLVCQDGNTPCAGDPSVCAGIGDGSCGVVKESLPVHKIWDNDCNNNAIADTCDLSCGGFAGLCADQDLLGCGGSTDVDGDGVPDECVTPPCDVDGNGVVDRNDIAVIFAARNTPASGPEDPRDANGDGIITVNDARACVLECTNPGCAP